VKYRVYVLILISIVCLFASGCAPVRHVTILPLNEDFDIEALEVEEPGLEGKWLLSRNGEVWEFENDKHGDVILKINGTWEVEILLAEYDFGQVLLIYDEELVADSRGLSLALAGLFLIRRDVKGMTLMEIDPEWLERLSAENPKEGWSRKFDDRIFITSTGGVDRLLREHGGDPGAFRRYGVLRPLESSQQ